MSPLTAAIVASAEGAEGNLVSPYVFGGVALGILVLLLIVTMLINVDR
ncbi:MAG: hypothetical protein RL347_989 [Actinomycetota bacterium]|jgi:hypothetical protein